MYFVPGSHRYAIDQLFLRNPEDEEKTTRFEPVEKPVAFDLGWKSTAILAIVIWYLSNRDKPVYLIDFALHFDRSFDQSFE